MGWASRCRTGLWARTQQAYRRERLTKNVMPRMIWHQGMHLVVALVLFPFRLVMFMWRAIWPKGQAS